MVSENERCGLETAWPGDLRQMENRQCLTTVAPAEPGQPADPQTALAPAASNDVFSAL